MTNHTAMFLKGLEDLQKAEGLSNIPSAAAKVLSIIVALKERKTIDKAIDDFVETAGKAVLDALNEFQRRGLNPGDNMPQDIQDYVSQIDSILGRLDEQIVQLPIGRVLNGITRSKSMSKFTAIAQAELNSCKLPDPQTTATSAQETESVHMQNGPTFEFGSNCGNTKIKDSGIVSNQSCVDPRTGQIYTPPSSNSGPGTRIKFGDDSPGVVIENSGNVKNSIVPMYSYIPQNVSNCAEELGNPQPRHCTIAPPPNSNIAT